jgi:osmotically-inducible protein OsmY
MFTVSLIVALCFTAPSSPGPINQDELTPQEMRYLVLETEVALANNAQIGYYPFKIETQQNTIVLSGEVPANEARLLAERIAQQVLRDYNVKVINKIRVIIPEAEPAPPGKPTPFDQEQMEKVRQLIDDNFPDLAENITVSFDTQPMPTIVLEGLIPVYEQKLALSRFLRSNFRDLPLVNNLRVRRIYEGEKSFYVASPTNADRAVEPRRRIRSTDSALVVTGVRQGDVVIAKQLGAALKADPVIKNCIIEVRVDDGVAWLSGRVESPGQKVRAIKLASVQPGVRYVVNQLEIRPIAEEPSVVKVLIPEPEDITIYVRRYLQTRMPGFEDSEVRVKGDTIIVVPPSDSEFAEIDLRDAEARLRKIPELKGYSVTVDPVVIEKPETEKP